MYGWNTLTGIGVYKDKKRGEEKIIISMKKGNKIAESVCFYYAFEKEKNVMKSFEILIQIIENTDHKFTRQEMGIAFFLLGLIVYENKNLNFFTENETENIFSKIIFFFQQSIKYNNPSAYHYMALLNQRGEKKNNKKKKNKK